MTVRWGEASRRSAAAHPEGSPHLRQHHLNLEEPHRRLLRRRNDPSANWSRSRIGHKIIQSLSCLPKRGNGGTLGKCLHRTQTSPAPADQRTCTDADGSSSQPCRYHQLPGHSHQVGLFRVRRSRRGATVPLRRDILRSRRNSPVAKRSGCPRARCTCGEAVRFPDEQSEEPCEARSQESERVPLPFRLASFHDLPVASMSSSHSYYLALRFQNRNNLTYPTVGKPSLPRLLFAR